MDSLNLPLKDLRINIEDINKMEPVSFPGDIHLVDSKEKVKFALDVLSYEDVIGFDTESRPAFLKGQKFPVSIIQLSTLKDAFIFQLKYTQFSDSIIEILSNADIQKVGVGVNDDIARLNKLHNFQAQNFLDLSSIAKSKGLIQSGARALTARYLGKRLIKSSQKTNWAKKELTERQLLYAATDAWICLHIKEPLLADNTDYSELLRIYNEEHGLDLSHEHDHEHE